MSAADRLTKTSNINVTAREIDFVTRFSRNWEHLADILGIMKPIKKENGAVLKSKNASVVLQSGAVDEGDTIPYSQATVSETPYAEMNIEKYRKGVTIEAIKTYGYDVAVALTDDAFLRELQDNVVSKFYTYLNTGTLTNIQTTYQMTLAMAKGLVENKFKKMHRTCTEVVGFCNILDVYEYIGAASITVQNEFGFNYIKNFMGYSTIFLLSDDEIARKTVIATPVENINLYYVDPSDSEFARAGLVYTTDGETNLVGFHIEGNYGTAVSDSFALLGLTLFAEYIDAIAVVEYEASGSADSITLASAAGTDRGTKITVTYDLPADETLYFKVDSNPSASYKDMLDDSWTLVPMELMDEHGVIDNVTKDADTNYTGKMLCASFNGSGQLVAVSSATAITNKS